jgi:hypothetical protein
MTEQQARSLLPLGRTWLAYYGDFDQPGFEEWYMAEGHTFILRLMTWGEWTAYGIRAL